MVALTWLDVLVDKYNSSDAREEKRKEVGKGGMRSHARFAVEKVASLTMTEGSARERRKL